MRVIVQPVGKSLQKVIDNDFKRFPQKAERHYNKAVKRAVEQYEIHVKSMPPVSKRTTGYGNRRGMPTDTSDLRRSIKSKPMPRMGIAAGVYTRIAHAIPVHEGTKQMPARPFFEWSLQMGSDKIIHEVLKRYTNSFMK